MSVAQIGRHIQAIRAENASLHKEMHLLAMQQPPISTSSKPYEYEIVCEHPWETALDCREVQSEEFLAIRRRLEEIPIERFDDAKKFFMTATLGRIKLNTEEIGHLRKQAQKRLRFLTKQTLKLSEYQDSWHRRRAACEERMEALREAQLSPQYETRNTRVKEWLNRTFPKAAPAPEDDTGGISPKTISPKTVFPERNTLQKGTLDGSHLRGGAAVAPSFRENLFAGWDQEREQRFQEACEDSREQENEHLRSLAQNRVERRCVTPEAGVKVGFFALKWT